jgi:molybdenum cofactor sulfurtransferase
MAARVDDGYNRSVEIFREEEYPMLKGWSTHAKFLLPSYQLSAIAGSVYLDHAGTTLYSKSLMDEFSREMVQNLFGNPHSASPSSQLSTLRVEDVRLRALQFLNADPLDFDLVFVANATAGIKLVAEALRALPGGFQYGSKQSLSQRLRRRGLGSRIIAMGPRPSAFPHGVIRLPRSIEHGWNPVPAFVGA